MFADKILWTGLFVFIALNQVLALFGFDGNSAITNVGAVVFLVGVVVKWLNR